LKAAITNMNADEQALYDRLVALFGKHGRTMVDAIRAGDGLSFDALLSGLRQVIVPQLAHTMLGKMQDLAEQVGPDQDPAVAHTAASDWAERYGYDLIKGIDDTTRANVQRAVSTYHSTPGMTRDQLVDQLRPTFGTTRAQSIAITEATRAAAAGTRAYQSYLAENGITMERVNQTNNDDLVCAICGPLNQAVESDWPDDAGPPWHVRCRCAVSLRRVATAETTGVLAGVDQEEPFVAATTTAEAESFARDLGVAVNYRGELEIGNMINETLAEIKGRGVALPLRVSIDADYFDDLGPNAQYVPGSYFPDLERVVFNPKSMPMGNRGADLAGVTQVQHDAGFWSTDHPRAIIRHELGHAAHHQLIGDRYIEKALKAWPEGAVEALQGKVSHYAMTQPRELVAEVFAGLVDGRTYDTTVMRWYREFGGPEL